MKLKHISTLLVFLFAFSFYGFSQNEEEEVELFSIDDTRGYDTNQHDFGSLASVASYMITIKNSGQTDMIIDYIKIPSGVSITIMQDKIKSKKSGEIKISVDPSYLDDGTFLKKIVIVTSQVDLQGVKISKEVNYTVKGIVQK